MLPKTTKRLPPREGYDLWSSTYDQTPNPVVAMDSRHTMNLLAPQPGQNILDAGCGTGRNLALLRSAGAHAYGLDFSLGMLRVALQKAAGVPLVQADLQSEFPFRAAQFSAVLCALIGEHLEKLPVTLSEIHRVLEPDGRMVFSVYHPDLAEAGKEANFQLNETEYRLGAIRYTAADYLGMIRAAGFAEIAILEFKGDQELVREVPQAAGLLDQRVILAFTASAGSSQTGR